MVVEVGALSDEVLLSREPGEPSQPVRQRVLLARQKQIQRQARHNAALPSSAIDEHCQPDPAGLALLQKAVNKLAWSARAYHRVLRLARTVADLAGSDQIESRHISEAIQYRRGIE